MLQTNNRKVRARSAGDQECHPNPNPKPNPSPNPKQVGASAGYKEWLQELRQVCTDAGPP